MDLNNKALEFDVIANTIFYPIYPVIAEQILCHTGIEEGVCIDLGCGGGHLGLSLLQQSCLRAYMLDINPRSLEICQERAEEWNLGKRISCLTSSADAIPLPDESVDLCVSRGSIWFWPDLKAALTEIVRIMKPGGKAYLGGGFGNPALKAEIDIKMKAFDPSWPSKSPANNDKNSLNYYRQLLKEIAGVRRYEVSKDEQGFWLRFEKAAEVVKC